MYLIKWNQLKIRQNNNNLHKKNTTRNAIDYKNDKNSFLID